MRLIDADALMEEIAKHSYIVQQKDNSRDLGMTVYGIQQCVDEQPTAYDVEDKIKKLQQLAGNGHRDTLFDHKWELFLRANAVYHIVKGGGTND